VERRHGQRQSRDGQQSARIYEWLDLPTWRE
jgi:hypothetical protein